VASVARHLTSIAILPFTVTVVVPTWLARRYGVTGRWPADAPAVALTCAAAALLLVGGALFAASLRRFETEGDGTLAPWDPPRRLVVRGPYRYVRNPMISGVLFVLFAEALFLRSRVHLIWALVFAAMNVTWIPLYEEPTLEQRFGDDYREYKANVRRFMPRLRPWAPGSARSRRTAAPTD
jgi:protein-S-isoprenylcysteine O-methyltransferase Ste14